LFSGGTAKKKITLLESRLQAISERSELLDEACGVGLWDAVMPNADPAHPEAKWTWSAEFRRLCGYRTEADYPNVMQSWSDRLHPDDAPRVFAAFGGHLQDKSGNTRYDATYRLKMPDGSYRWFRATGGCRYSADGATARACGSLSDIHAQTMAEAAIKDQGARTAAVADGLSAALKALPMATSPPASAKSSRTSSRCWRRTSMPRWSVCRTRWRRSPRTRKVCIRRRRK
jgi:methyl-accepting chemotaxis protein